MKPLKHLTAGVALAGSILGLCAPAQAVTARQQALQGEGIFTTSKGVPQNYGEGYYPQGDGQVGYDRGYRPRGWGRHHRRTYEDD